MSTTDLSAAERATCPEHQQLLTAAAQCSRDLSRFQEDNPGHERAREVLAGMIAHLRAAAQVFDIDPTLADEPSATGRFRAVDLLAELARQVQGGLRNATSGRALHRQPAEERWAEVEALYARACQFAKIAQEITHRPDHGTAAGSQAISRLRLAADHGAIRQAAETLAGTTRDAARLPHRAPEVDELMEIALRLHRIANSLEAAHDASQEALAAAMWPNREASTAAQEAHR